MAKYQYVGDPKGKPSASGSCQLVDRHTGQKVTFNVGEPREVPAWAERCVKNNSHFKMVADKPLSLGDKK